MKKTIAKQLRGLAESLPPLYMDKVIGTKIKGSDILKEYASKEMDAPKDIDPDSIYKQKYIARVPMNHYKNLKHGYQKIGPSIIPQYVSAVNSVVKEQIGRAHV